ncbi:hypothetical protein BVRB_7g167310 [Beta vulgaris subsp. vulgaris]|nr:hypothetical protein BVRB_7g167310 [Beta vulgaris subsp. vulgaris]
MGEDDRTYHHVLDTIGRNLLTLQWLWYHTISRRNTGAFQGGLCMLY